MELAKKAAQEMDRFLEPENEHIFDENISFFLTRKRIKTKRLRSLLLQNSQSPIGNIPIRSEPPSGAPL